MTHRPGLSLVLPVLDEGATLAQRLHALAPLRARGAEVVVVDGGSTDHSWMQARAQMHPTGPAGVDRLLLAPRGRAAQMNAGAAVARGEVLLFLHADTTLPPEADRLVRQAIANGAVWGRFDVHIEGRHPLLPRVATLMNWRSRLSGIATGDQAIFVTREAFERVGGFAPQPLMEDIALSTRLKRIAPPACLQARVRTSGRRWDQQGLWRTIVLMWRLRAAYARGADPAALALRYGYRAPEPLPCADIAVLAKAPVPGLAKTRLIPLLGAAGAARVQRRFARDTLHLALQTATLLQGRVALWAAPDAAQPFFRALVRAVRSFPTGRAAPSPCLQLHDQRGGDIGQRMAHAFDTHFRAQADRPLLLIGTDCPPLAPGHLLQAAVALQAHDAVLIPAEDGGYALIGLRRSCPSLFEGVDWSTDRVLGQTRERLRSAGMRWHELPALWDVDTPDDWVRLQRESILSPGQDGTGLQA